MSGSTQNSHPTAEGCCKTPSCAGPAVMRSTKVSRKSGRDALPCRCLTPVTDGHFDLRPCDAPHLEVRATGHAPVEAGRSRHHLRVRQDTAAEPELVVLAYCHPAAAALAASVTEYESALAATVLTNISWTASA